MGFQFRHCLAVWPWACPLTSPSLGVLKGDLGVTAAQTAQGHWGSRPR